MKLGELDKLLPIREEAGTTFETKTGWGYDASFSVAVLSLLPFSVAGNRRQSRMHRYEIEKVEERMFVPSQDYVRQSMFQAEVLSYLARYRWKKSVYMIVGIKVAQGGKIVHETEHALGGHLAGALPGASVGVPLDVGATVSTDTLHSRHEQKQIPNAFVFAYRLREIRYSKKRGFIDHQEFTKGADLHELHGPKKATSIELLPSALAIRIDDIEIDGLSGADFEEDEDDSMLLDGCVVVGLTQ